MPTRIIHARSDFMFKKLFADEFDKTNLKLLLSAILTDISVDEFEDITFKETILPSNEKEGKICVLDLLVSTKSGMRINIEIQIVGGQVFITRMVYYNAKLVLSQLLSGDHYSELKRSVSIFILDFELIDDGEYYHCFRFYDKASDRELTDLTEMITIELPKVEALTDGTAIWSWAMLFKAKTEEELEMLKTNPELSRAVETIRHFSKDEEAWLQFEAEEKARMDYQAYIAESRAEGIAEGITKGRAEGKLETARAMLGKGFDILLISEITTLSVSEIEALKD